MTRSISKNFRKTIFMLNYLSLVIIKKNENKINFI